MEVSVKEGLHFLCCRSYDLSAYRTALSQPCARLFAF